MNEPTLIPLNSLTLEQLQALAVVPKSTWEARARKADMDAVHADAEALAYEAAGNAVWAADRKRYANEAREYAAMARAKAEGLP